MFLKKSSGGSIAFQYSRKFKIREEMIPGSPQRQSHIEERPPLSPAPSTFAASRRESGYSLKKLSHKENGKSGENSWKTHCPMGIQHMEKRKDSVAGHHGHLKRQESSGSYTDRPAPAVPKRIPPQSPRPLGSPKEAVRKG